MPIPPIVRARAAPHSLARIRLCGAGVLAAVLAAGAASAQEGRDTVPVRLDTVRVEVARLKAAGVPLSRTPYGAQVIELPAAPNGRTVTLAHALRNAVGISTASQFGSPIQPDLRFRGFQVGPVMGFPQSVSVFVDGVRVNEADASEVNFDLIPLDAVERIEVIRSPGGAFGRNTLAGAINVVTRRGSAGEGARGGVETDAGSFRTARARGWLAGGLDGGLDYLASARYYRSDGWRDLSAAELRQLFGKLGYSRGGTDAWVSYTFAADRVEGPGSLPSSWLEGRLPPDLTGTADPRRLQFTGFEGDRFEPRLHFGVLNASQALDARTRLQVNGYARSIRFSQFNDNITEPNALNRTSALGLGATIQLVRALASGGSWTVGAEAVRDRTEIGIFEAPNPAFPDAGGRTEDVASTTRNEGLFAQFWQPFSTRASLTGSLRYDHVYLPMTDRLEPENSGVNVYDQVTGSLGGEIALASGLRAFAGYGHGFRAPVVLEVSCADPADPCPLPFELGADPPLKPVTTDTWQAGLRYYGAAASRAELVAFRSAVHDELFNVVLPPSTRGYFKNLDRTRREGLELSAEVRPRPVLKLSGSLALTRATFQSPATLSSALLEDDDDAGAAAGGAEEGGEEAGEGAVRVEPGDRFAMVPGVTGQLGGELSPGAWRFELEGSFVGSQFFQGDEANGERFGKLPAYSVIDGRVERAWGSAALYVEGENLLNRRYGTFGIISPNIRGPDRDPQPFLTPGLPFHLRVGVRYGF
jgi:outer membrane receptor protein involved in Fe transport